MVASALPERIEKLICVEGLGPYRPTLRTNPRYFYSKIPYKINNLFYSRILRIAVKQQKAMIRFEFVCMCC